MSTITPHKGDLYNVSFNYMDRRYTIEVLLIHSTPKGLVYVLNQTGRVDYDEDGNEHRRPDQTLTVEADFFDTSDGKVFEMVSQQQFPKQESVPIIGMMMMERANVDTGQNKN